MTIYDLQERFLDFNDQTTVVVMDYYELNTTTFPSYQQLNSANPNLANSEIY